MAGPPLKQEAYAANLIELASLLHFPDRVATALRKTSLANRKFILLAHFSHFTLVRSLPPRTRGNKKALSQVGALSPYNGPCNLRDLGGRLRLRKLHFVGPRYKLHLTLDGHGMAYFYKRSSTYGY